MRREYARRRDFVCAKLKEMGVERVQPAGAFYAFAQIPPKMERKSSAFVEYLIQTAHVAVAPGIFFGKDYDDYFRLSFSASMEDLEKGIEQLKHAL
jgi:aminotransferase